MSGDIRDPRLHFHAPLSSMQSRPMVASWFKMTAGVPAITFQLQPPKRKKAARMHHRVLPAGPTPQISSTWISLARAQSCDHSWMQVKPDNIVVYTKQPRAQLKSGAPATERPAVGKYLHLGEESLSLSLTSVAHLLCELRQFTGPL